MAEINKKLVKYATEAKFEEHLTGLADKINPKSVVFIENTGRIWTHGKYYDGAWAGISGKPTTFAPSAHTHSNFNRTVSGFVPAPGLATTTRYLREDGSWFVPPNTNTTYLTNTLAHLNAGTDTVGKLQTAKNLHEWLSGKGYITNNVSNINFHNIVPSSPRDANRRFFNVAQYHTSGDVQGVIVIELPGYVASMEKLRISGWGYSKSWDIILSGYSGSSYNSWLYTGNATILGNPPFGTNDVQLAASETNSKFYVLLGTPSTVYGHYLSISVDAESYYSNSLSSTGWDIYVSPSEPPTTSKINPITAIYGGEAQADKFIKKGGTSTQFLKADGSVDSNTYITASSIPSEIPISEIDAGTSATVRTITGRRVKHILDKKSDSNHNHTLKLIAGASTATVNSAADVANPYIRLFSDNTHQGNIQIVGGTNVGVVSKNGIITLTSSYTNTTYSTGTLDQLNKGTDTTGRLQTAKLLNDWLNPKLDNKFDKTGGRLTAGIGDVNIELWRGTNASWNILNSGGYLRFQSNYTTVAGAYFDALKLDYNTGNALFKGAVTATSFLGKATSAGNADTANGQKFNWTNTSNSPTYLWAANANGTAFLASRANISVKYATSAGSITGFTSGWSNSGEHNANNISSNGMWYYTSNGPTTAQGSSTNDGALYSQAHSTAWVAQIAQDYRNGRLFVRGKNNGTWKSWLNILDSGNSSVSGNTIKINGTSTTWVNTHRGIQNNLTSTSAVDSLSAAQGRLLANGSARDSTKLALSGGSVTGTLNLSKNTPSGTAYNVLGLHIHSSGGHPVGIGFHRGGYTQTILAHEGSGLVVRTSTISTGALAPITASSFVGKATSAGTADTAANATKWAAQGYSATQLTTTPTYLMGYDGSNWRPLSNNIYEPTVSSYSFTKSLQLSTTWQDTGIGYNNIPTGTYAFSVYSNNYSVGGGNYSSTFSGVINWYSSGTNYSGTDEILMQGSGHASPRHIYIRVIHSPGASGTHLRLQIATDVNTTAVSSYIFKFKQII